MSCANCPGKVDLVKLIDGFTTDKTRLIEYLQTIQEQMGYVSTQSIELLSKKIGVSESEIYSVVTFYSQFTLVPRAKHKIEICMGTACYVLGAEAAIKEFENQLNIKLNETTSDGMFSLTQSRCLGCCGLAPVVAVNGEIIGKVTPDKVEGIIKDAKGR